MKKIAWFIAILVSFFANAQNDKNIPDPPKPPTLVNNFTKEKLLTDEQQHHLERKLVQYDDTSSNQITVVIVEDLHGYDANEFATKLGQKWGVGGQEKFDNGVVVLVSTGGGKGNRAAYIAVGYGLEGAIPDVTAGHIVDEFLIPNLASGEYFKAFDLTTNAIIQAAAGEYKAPSGYRKRGKGNVSIGKIIVGIIILFVILSIFGGGNRGGGYMSRRGYRGFWGPTIFPTGGWGGSSGGGGWSGGGGGGFGGFGGGSFGGGGAGGSW